MRRGLSNPSARHEQRVELLDAVARLSGHHVHIERLPDGSAPDIVRADLPRRRIFIGDAKVSEGPGDQASLARLERYVAWLAVHARAGGAGCLVVCCASMNEADPWSAALASLLREHCVGARSRSVFVAPSAAFAVATLESQPPSGRGSGGEDGNVERVAFPA